MKRKILLECSLCDWTETIALLDGLGFRIAQMASDTHQDSHGPSGVACTTIKPIDVGPPNPILNPHEWAALGAKT